MTYTGSVTLSSESRIDTLNELADEEGAKTEAVRRLLDAAGDALDNDLASNDETTIEAIEAAIDAEADRQRDEKIESDGGTMMPVEARDYDNLDHGHGIKLAKNEEDWADTDVVSATHQARLPVLEAILNDWRERNDNPDTISKDDLEYLIRDSFGVSENTVRNYIDKLVENNVLYAHPCVDERIWSKRARKDIRLRVAGEWELCESLRDMPEHKQDLYADSSARDLFKPRSAYSAFASKHNQVYFFDRGEYKKEVWGAIAPALKTMATMTPRKTGKSKLKEGDYCKAWFHLIRKTLNITNRDDLWSPSEYEELSTALNRAMASEDEDSDTYDRFLTFFNGFKTEFDAEWSPDDDAGVGSVEDMSVSEARDVLGVGENVEEEGIMKVYRSRVTDVHPDQNDADGAAKEFLRVKRAKEVLLE